MSSHRTVRVWKIALDRVDLSQTREVLSADERQRAAGLASPLLNRRFFARRLAMRFILGEVMAVGGESLRFSYSGSGKPRLDMSGAPSFSLSASGDVALLAISEEPADIGVDVEFRRLIHDLDRLAERTMTPATASQLAAQPASDRPYSFLRWWCRREAVAKASGLGVGKTIDRFEVPLGGIVGSRIELRRGEGSAAPAFYVQDINAGELLVAAVAASGPIDDVQIIEWPPPNS